jgi:hypothetical protein
MKRGETLGVRQRLTTLFKVVAVFDFSFAKGSFVNLTWWVSVL